MKIAIGTSWYKGVPDDKLERLIKSFSLFDQEQTYFYIYCDEAPEETKTDLIKSLLKKYCIQNYNIIQGHCNNAVYYAKRKLVHAIKESLCCIIDCDDEFTKEFADYCKTHKYNYCYSLYLFGANCIGSNSMAYTGDKARLEAFQTGNHLCVWGKIIQTKVIKSAYELLPKYQYKFIYGEENLVVSLIRTMPTKTVNLKMLNYYEGGMSTVDKIKTVEHFRKFLTAVYLATIDGGETVISYVQSRLPLCEESIITECKHLFIRYVNAVKKLSDMIILRMKNGELLPDIERDVFENNAIDFIELFGNKNICNWLPEDK